MVLNRGDGSARGDVANCRLPSAKASPKRTTMLEGYSMNPSIDSLKDPFLYGVGDDAFQSPAEHVRSRFKLSLVRIRRNIRKGANARHA